MSASAVKEVVVGENVSENSQAVAGGLDDGGHLGADLARRRLGDNAGLLQVAQARLGLLLERHLLHVATLEGGELGRVETGRGLYDTLEREGFDHLLAGEVLGRVIERPAQHQQVVDDGLGQVADLLVEVDDDRVEGLGRGGKAQSLGDGRAVLVDVFEVFVVEVLLEIALAEFLLAARLGDDGQVGVGGQLVSQRLGR